MHSISSTTGDASAGGPANALPTIRVVPWDDPQAEPGRVDPRSAYVEYCWLPILGPSATWLLRRMADGLDASPSGYLLELAEAARGLGLGVPSGRQSPFLRSLGRLERYGMTRLRGPRTVAARRLVSVLPNRYLVRIPAAARAHHRSWTEELDRDIVTVTRDQARLLALDLLALGPQAGALAAGGVGAAGGLGAGGLGAGGAEGCLQRWGAHPSVAYDAVVWARTRLARAAAAGAGGGAGGGVGADGAAPGAGQTVT